jgi:hypothetical protein
MTDKDFMIGTVGLPTINNITKKPCYLVELLDNMGKQPKKIYFLSLDKPETLNGFIQVKGIYSSLLEEELVKKFGEILSVTPKEQILELMIPWHRVYSIRSLVFNANKPSSLIK